MQRFLRHWLVTAIALGATAWVLPGVRADSAVAVAVTAIVLGFLNAAVKPLVVLLTLPLTLLTLGLFYFVLNGVFFGLAAAVVPGFHVDSLVSAILGALVMSVLSFLLGDVDTRADRRAADRVRP